MHSILVIDDDKITHSFIKRALEGTYQLFPAFNGEEGLQQAAAIRPNIILLDVEMPGMNGYEVCEILKASEATKQIPVIFLSSHSSLRERMQGFEAGADDYIVKPFQPEDLKAKLQVVGRYRKTEEELSNQIQEAKQTVHAALSGSSDLGQAIYFIERCHNVSNYEQLAQEFFKISNNLGLACTLVIESIDNESFYSSKLNAVPPLESELISTLRNEKRFFDFGCRTQINYQHISLLIKNMPLDDMERYGRVKDLFPAMLSAADTKISQLDTLSSIKLQAEDLSKSISLISAALGKVKRSVTNNQTDSMTIMRDMLTELDRELPRMGLEDDQEQFLLDRIDRAITNAHETSTVTKEISDYFNTIIKDLETQASQQQHLVEKLSNITSSDISSDGETDEGYSMDIELF